METRLTERAERLLADLASSGARLVLSRNGAVLFRSNGRGLRSLLEAVGLPQAAEFRGADAADTTVGKAAAMLFAHLGVGFVAAGVMSEAGAEALRRLSIPHAARETVPAIQGRTPGRPCPFESAVAMITDPREALVALKETARRLFA